MDLGRYIRPSRQRVTEMYPDADMQQIVDTVLYADRMGSAFTTRLAPKLVGKNDYETLENIWRFVRKNIRYRRDKSGRELIKSPGATWRDGYGDCKSMSVFVGALLRNLGYPYFFRVARYDPQYPEQGHIYPIAVLPNGDQVVVDAVNSRFNEEWKYWKKQDYQPRRALDAAAVSGAPAVAGVGNSWGWVAAAIAAAILIARKENAQ